MLPQRRQTSLQLRHHVSAEPQTSHASLCGESGVPLLDSLLNGRGFLGKREDSGLRACAAMALGRVASMEATIVLQRAAADEKDVIVRNAVNKALRGSGS